MTVQWTWQFRIATTPNNDGSPTNYPSWKTSARKYEDVKDAAIGAATVQATCAQHGILMEARLVPATATISNNVPELLAHFNEEGSE